MKNIYIILTVIMLFLMLVLPVFAIGGAGAKEETPVTPSLDTEKGKITVFDGKENQTIGVEDYLVGVLAAEMPAAYHEEALKAQAVAAYTYALYTSQNSGDADYDITADSSLNQGYTSIEKAREKWGDNADEFESKLRSAVKSVLGEYLSYDGKPILAAFHSMSSGKTENCSDVWGKDLPYLKSVDSMGDLLCEDYLCSTQISLADFENCLSEKCTFSGNAADYIQKIERSETGSVKSITLCGAALSGSAFRKLLGLRSANFDITFTDNAFSITTRGYGHGVGMSQHGAEYMAQSGSTYKEILGWYYTGCSLSKSDL